MGVAWDMNPCPHRIGVDAVRWPTRRSDFYAICKYENPDGCRDGVITVYESVYHSLPERRERYFLPALGLETDYLVSGAQMKAQECTYLLDDVEQPSEEILAINEIIAEISAGECADNDSR